MVEYDADETTVPEKSLGGEIVDAEGVAELDIGDGLVEGEIGGKEGDENAKGAEDRDVVYDTVKPSRLRCK